MFGNTWSESLSNVVSQVSESVAPIVREVIEEATEQQKELKLGYDDDDDEDEDTENDDEQDDGGLFGFTQNKTKEEDKNKSYVNYEEEEEDTESDADIVRVSGKEGFEISNKHLHEKEVIMNQESLGETINSLEKDKLSTDKEILDLRDEKEDLVAKNRKLEARLEEFQFQLKDYKKTVDRLEDLEVQNNSFQQQMKDYENTVENLKRLNAENNILKQSKEDELGKLQRQVNVQREENEKIISERESLLQRIGALESRQQDKDDVVIVNNDNNTNRENEILQEKLRTLQQRIDVFEQETAEKDREIERLLKLAENSAQKEEDNDRLKELSDKLEKEKSKLSESLNLINQLEDTVKNQNIDKENLIKELDQQAKILNESRSSEEAYTALQSQQNEFEKERLELLNQLEHYKTRYTNISNSFDRLQESANVTLGSEKQLETKCREYENMVDDLETQLLDFKRKFNKADEERHMMKTQVQNLQEEVKRRSLAQKQGVNALTGQLGEIEHLRSEIASFQTKEDGYKREIGLLIGAQQQVHKLNAELKATKAELQVAEADLERIGVEKKNLYEALGELNNDIEIRTKLYEKKLNQLEEKLLESEQNTKNIKEQSKEEINTLKSQLDSIKTKLAENEQKLVVANEQILTYQNNASRTEQKRTVSRDENDEKEEEKNKEIEPVFDKSLFKKLLVTYFERKRTSTFQAQQEILVLLSNMLEMNQDEKEILDLVEPKRDRSGSNFLLDDASKSLIKRILFGDPAFEEIEDTDDDDLGVDGNRRKGKLGLKAMEEAISEKPFGDLWQDVLNQDL